MNLNSQRHNFIFIFFYLNELVHFKVRMRKMTACLSLVCVHDKNQQFTIIHGTVHSYLCKSSWKSLSILSTAKLLSC